MVRRLGEHSLAKHTPYKGVALTEKGREVDCNAMRAMMDQYSTAMRHLAEKYHAVFVDTQAAFDAALEYHHPHFLAWDRIHPNPTGHMIIARAFLNAVGFTW
jgi:lysophospholipase L1-like esterase